MVGVSEAAPSRHFAGIDELLAMIAASGYRDLAALRVGIRDSEDTALVKAYRMMRVYIEFAQRHNAFAISLAYIFNAQSQCHPLYKKRKT